jgi:hypothetical protein
VGVASVGRLRHPDAEVPGGDRPRNEFQGDGAALAIGDAALGKRLPSALHGAVIEGLHFASPELDGVVTGVGIGPSDAYGVDVDFGAKVDHDPLRMERIVFAGKGLGEVRIAFPVGFQITVGEAGPAVTIAAAEAAMGKRVSVGVANHLGGLGAAREVALLFLPIAPSTAGIPVPGLDHEFGVLTIGYGLPAGPEDFLQNGIGQQGVGVFVDFLFGEAPIFTSGSASARSEAIDGPTQGAKRAERIRDVRGSRIDDDILRGREVRRAEERADRNGQFVHTALDFRSHEHSSASRIRF